MSDVQARAEAETAAIEMLRDLIGNNFSDTTLRDATDYLLSFHRSTRPTTATVSYALRRLIEIAKSDTGQAARVVLFLDELGHFPIADLFGVDNAIAADIAVSYPGLGRSPQRSIPTPSTDGPICRTSSRAGAL